MSYEQWHEELAKLLNRYPLMKYKKYIKESTLKSFYGKYKYTPKQAAQIIFNTNLPTVKF